MNIIHVPLLQVSLAAEHIRNEKVKVLRSMKKLSLDDVVIGQYRGRSGTGVDKPGYLDDDTVPEGRSAPQCLNSVCCPIEEGAQLQV